MTDNNEAQNSSKSDNAPDSAPDNASGNVTGKASGSEPDKGTKTESNDKDASASETETAPRPSLREPFPFARLFLTIVFGVIASVAFWLFVVLAMLQFLTIAIAGQKNEELQYFSRRMGRFIQEVFDYITLASDTQPFPLGPFPKE